MRQIRFEAFMGRHAARIFTAEMPADREGRRPPRRHGRKLRRQAPKREDCAFENAKAQRQRSQATQTPSPWKPHQISRAGYILPPCWDARLPTSRRVTPKLPDQGDILFYEALQAVTRLSWYSSSESILTFKMLCRHARADGRREGHA